MSHSLRWWLAGLGAVALAACGPKSEAPATDPATTEAEAEAPVIELTEENVVGTWSGVLKVPTGQELTLVLHIGMDEETGELAATLDSPDQGANGIPGENAKVEDGTFSADIPMVGAAIIFEPAGDGSMNAVLNQGMPMPFKMTRGYAPKERLRPQEPTERPYVIEEVTFPGGADGVTLAGELTLPEGEGPFPGVILISGSGPQDRNEELMEHKPFLVLSDDLTRKGYAVLRYDDRGFAESTGDFDSATTEDFATDAAAALRFLKADPRVDASRIAYMGHSEGGLIAPLAAGMEKPAAMVLLAGPSVTLSEVIIEQSQLILRAEGGTEAQIATAKTQNEAVFEILRSSENAEDAKAKVREALIQMGVPENAVDAQVNQVVSPWMLWAMDHDPKPGIAAFDGPVLALFGSKDLQVPPSQSEGPMREVLTQDGSEIIVLDGLNHLFQPAETGGMSEYINIETTFDPSALNAISDWLDENL